VFLCKQVSKFVPEALENWAMGNRRMCRYANVATGKKRIKFADAKCGCVGKMRMCG